MPFCLLAPPMVAAHPVRARPAWVFHKHTLSTFRVLTMVLTSEVHGSTLRDLARASTGRSRKQPCGANHTSRHCLSSVVRNHQTQRHVHFHTAHQLCMHARELSRAAPPGGTLAPHLGSPSALRRARPPPARCVFHSTLVLVFDREWRSRAASRWTD